MFGYISKTYLDNKIDCIPTLNKVLIEKKGG